MKEFYNKNKLLLWITFTICILLAILSSVSAYSCYPNCNQGGSMSYSAMSMSIGVPNTSNLADLGYYERLFDFSKQYYSTFTSLGEFEDYSHIAATYSYRPSNNENYVHIFFSYDPIINRPGVNQNTQQNTFTSLGRVLLDIFIDNYSGTANYRIYYDFTSNQYISMSSGIISLQGGTIYGYLTNNNNYHNDIIYNYYDMTTLDVYDYYNMVYNPDLLVGNSNYKKACVGYNQMFTINGNYSNYILYNMPLYGLTEYYFQAINSVETMNPVTSLHNLIYRDPLDLNNFLSNSTNSSYLNSAGYYSSINDYFGWSFFRIDNTFTDIYNFDLTIYKFDDVFSYKPDCIEVESGGITSCVHQTDAFSNEIIINPNNEYCFYIPSSSDIKILNVNEYGDIDDSITINGITYVLNSYYFESGYTDFSNSKSYKGFIGSLIGFLKQAGTPIGFINSKISFLFNSLPVPVQNFIIALLVGLMLIIIIKLLANKH